jgi:phage terminase small subunit
MVGKKLSPRESKFVKSLLEGMGKRDAAIAAGYSLTGAHVSASQLLSRERVLNALRDGAEAKMKAGVAIGAAVLIELAEKGRSEDVRLRAATALLDRGGMPLVRQSEIRHTLEDRRSDRELLEHARQLAKQLGVAMPAGIVDAAFEEIQPAALPAPQPEPVVEPVAVEPAHGAQLVEAVPEPVVERHFPRRRPKPAADPVPSPPSAYRDVFDT